MATIRERGPMQWQAIVRAKNHATGQAHNETRTFPTKTEATAWAGELEADLRRAIHNDTRLLDATPLRELIERYMTEVSPKKLGGDQEITRLQAWLAWPHTVDEAFPGERQLKTAIARAERRRDQQTADRLAAELAELHEKNRIKRQADAGILANRPLSRIAPKDFADFIAGRRKETSQRGGPVSEQTIKHQVIVVSNVYEVARKDWGYNIANPTKQISKPGGSQAREIRIGDKLPALLDALRKCRNKQYPLIVEWAVETGMRQDEIMRMAWADIDKKQRLVEVEGKDTSRAGTRKRRIVPLSPRCMELLSTLPQAIDPNTQIFQTARKTSADGLSRAFTAACNSESVGLPGAVFHSTRHEAASRMAPHYSMPVLMSIMGWKTASMAARYYHADADELHAGLERMRLANSKR